MLTHITRVLIVAGIASIAGPLFAHHGTSTFDRERTITISGVVTAVKWSNPHVEIELRGAGAAGSERVWVVESFPPHGMEREGLAPDFLAIGDQVEITGHPAVELGRITAWASSVRQRDGTLTRLPAQTDFQPVAPD